MAITARNCCPGPVQTKLVAAWCCPAVGIPGAERISPPCCAMNSPPPRQADRMVSGNDELMLDADGTPRLRKLAPASPPKDLAEFEEVRARMPGAIASTFSNTPSTGRMPRGIPVHRIWLRSENHQRRATLLFTVFGYGCYLGPVQTARHALIW